MAKVIAIGQVKDVAMWENAFRTHGDMFKEMGIASPIYIGSNDNNEVVLLEEVADVDGLTSSVQSPETQAAMKSDGVIVESFKLFVLDREFSLD